jgi:hypothetical protein
MSSQFTLLHSVLAKKNAPKLQARYLVLFQFPIAVT